MGEGTGGAPAATDETQQATDDDAMLARLDATLSEAGIAVGAELDGDTLVLSGEVESEENRQAALDVARALGEPRGLRVDDALSVIDVAPDSPFLGDLSADTLGGGNFAYADPDANPDAQFDPVFETEPDFTEEIGTTDSQESAEEAVPYFPPTDPVVRPTTGDEQLAIVGGFGATSMDDLVGGASFDVRNDDDLAQAVHRELAEDGLTTDLLIRVSAADGVVTLRGDVPTLEDAENAEAVASRVGGVQEVREELGLPGLRRDR